MNHVLLTNSILLISIYGLDGRIKWQGHSNHLRTFFFHNRYNWLIKLVKLVVNILVYIV